MGNFSDRPQQHWHHERQTGYAPSIHTVHSQIVSNRVGIRSRHFAFEERGEVKIPALSPAMHLRSGQQPSVGRGAGGEQVAPREDTYGKCYRYWRRDQTHVCYITVYARQIPILLLKIASHCWSQSQNRGKHCSWRVNGHRVRFWSLHPQLNPLMLRLLSPSRASRARKSKHPPAVRHPSHVAVVLTKTLTLNSSTDALFLRPYTWTRRTFSGSRRPPSRPLRRRSRGRPRSRSASPMASRARYRHSSPSAF